MKAWEKVQDVATPKIHYRSEAACWVKEYEAGLRPLYKRPPGVDMDKVDCLVCLRNAVAERGILKPRSVLRLKELGFDK